MQTKKMSLANIQGKLSRAEMKKIMAGSGASCEEGCVPGPDAGCEENESCQNMTCNDDPNHCHYICMPSS